MTRSAESPAPVPVDAAALRIVLFGMPDAGKSSLLGALAQAAQVQERQLEGRLFDTTSGLAELQRRVYEDRPRETQQEIVPYPIRFEPFKGPKPDPAQRIDAVLFDCDGRVANEILTQVKSLDDPKAGHLADAVRRADALVLVVDASAADELIESDFTEFVRFLRLFEHHRTSRSEIGGLPVFLVLSKCDLLAGEGDSAAAWQERIAARREKLERRFHRFLVTEENVAAGFGSLAVDVEPTAVRRPALGQRAASREPYGVADLFRRVFHAARDYRQRARTSGRRTLVLAAAAALLLTGMIAGTVALVLNRDTIQPVALSGNVESYRARENPAPSARLTEPLQRKISELTDIQTHADFAKLAEEQRAFVEERLRELTAYQEYKAQLEREPRPTVLRSPEELNRAETRLLEMLGPPAEYQSEWAQTEAELLRQKRLDDIKAIRRAVTELVDRYAGFAAGGGELLQFTTREGAPLPWSEWHERARELLTRAMITPHPENEPLQGSRALPSMGQPAATYASVYPFRTVEDSRREWDTVRARLERLRDLSVALGLAGDSAPEVAPLRLPDDFTADQARTRLEELKRAYPNHGDWSPAEWSTAAGADLRLAAARSYQRLIEAGRRVVLRELRQHAGDGRESHEHWKSVARALPGLSDLREWSQLVELLQRLKGDPQVSPVAALVEFLQKSSFTLRFDTVRMTIPDDAQDTRLRPVGRLTIVHVAGGATRRLQFVRRDEEDRDNRRRITTFTFAQEGDQTLTFTPGDPIYAEATVRDGGTPTREWVLSWLQCSSVVYRFECLHLQPRIDPAGQPLQGESLVRNIRLTFAPAAGVPAIPELMPTVAAGR